MNNTNLYLFYLPCLLIFPVFTLYLQSIASKVNKQSGIDMEGRQIIDYLDLILPRQTLRSLQFNDDVIVYKHIRSVLPHHNTLIIDSNGCFGYHVEVVLSEFKIQGILIYLFQESFRQHAPNIIGALNNLSYLLFQRLSSLALLHPSHPLYYNMCCLPFTQTQEHVLKECVFYVFMS